MVLEWKKGRGICGELLPLIGAWQLEEQILPQNMPTDCRREFAAFGSSFVRLETIWTLPGRKNYSEICLFGRGEGKQLEFWSFTSDGKRSAGIAAGASDVHPAAIAFEADMPGGRARMVYWPDEEAGLRFAVERQSKRGWSRFLDHRYLRDERRTREPS